MPKILYLFPKLIQLNLFYRSGLSINITHIDNENTTKIELNIRKGIQGEGRLYTEPFDIGNSKTQSDWLLNNPNSDRIEALKGLTENINQQIVKRMISTEIGKGVVPNPIRGITITIIIKVIIGKPNVIMAMVVYERIVASSVRFDSEEKIKPIELLNIEAHKISNKAIKISVPFTPPNV